ncbi:MAG: hypothetical protein K6U14_02825 [Firmicutes bacterium]|nr:hypothetical protein [Alicyclobacillaceae bacterium]MCL6496554.1 hypothetical protein [Bacillota bacterium]
MTDWESEWVAPPEFQTALETFIRHPDQRQQDVYHHLRYVLDDGLALEWVVKHDLFEGAVAQWSLFDLHRGQYLAGVDRPLPAADAVWGTYQLTHAGRTYRLRVQPQ